MRLDFIEEILIPRLSHNPKLMLEIIKDITDKILGKRNYSIENEEPLDQQFKRVCVEAILWNIIIIKRALPNKFIIRN
jgi:hypothetical protein